MTKETAFKSLERIAKIENENLRKDYLRSALLENNNLAIVIQRCYHPNYNFDLPSGPLPETIAKKSNHSEHGPFYNSLRKWNIFRIQSEAPNYSNVKKHVKESQFIDLYESISNEDADLLIAVKDKKLPWETLNVEFVVDAVPELFPSSFRPTSSTITDDQKAKDGNSEPLQQTTDNNQSTTVVVSKKEICKQIMGDNPGLARKDYIQLFEAQGISKTTGSLYYQQLKGKLDT